MNLIIIASALLVYAEYNGYTKLKDDNKNLKKEISDVKEKIETIKSDNANYEIKIEQLKEEKKAELKELEIWKKLEEKLNQALL